MKKIFITGFVMIFLSITAFSASALELGAKAYYWFPSIVGDMSVSTSAISGTKLDLDDFGMDNKSYPVIEIFTGFGKNHISLSCYTAKYDGDMTLTSNVSFNGKTFNTGITAKNSLEYTVYDLVYRRDLLDLENMLAGVSLGVVGKVKYIDITAGLEGGGLKEEKTLNAPIPMVGANLHVGLLMNVLEATVQATGIGYGDSSIIELSSDVSLTMFPMTDIHLGYRSFRVNIDEEDVKSEFDTSGPYIAVSIGF